MREKSYPKEISHTLHDNRGGEKKVMKKGLALLLAASMTLSAFSSAALANDLTAEEKFQALVESGIFTGFEDGSSRLDENMTRAQFAAVIARMLDLDENASASNVFSDLVDAEWAAGYIGAAVEAGILEGMGDGTFAPSANVTVEQLATIMVRTLDLEVDANATVAGASDWAQGYVAAAIAAGLISESADYTGPAKRELLVETSFTANDIVNVPEVLEVEAAVKGMREVQVNFNKAVDSETAEISVKRDGVNAVNVEEITFSEDGKSATLEFATDLTEAEYTVSVSGVDEEAATATFEITEEQVAKIEFVSEYATFNREDENVDALEDRRVYVRVKFSNQYGEDVTEEYIDDADTEFDFSDVKEEDVEIVDEEQGLLLLEFDETEDEWELGDTINASVFYDNEDGDTVSAKANLTVAEGSEVNDIKIVELVNKTDPDDTLDADDNYGDWYLVVNVWDQYGQELVGDMAVYALNEDVRADVDNNDVVDVDEEDAPFEEIDIDGDDYLAIPLIEPDVDDKEAGEATVTLTSRAGNASAEYTINLSDYARIDTIKMSQPNTKAAGEEIRIPVTAIDTNGDEVTDKDVFDIYEETLSDQDGGLREVDADGLAWKFEKNAKTGKIELVVDSARNENGTPSGLEEDDDIDIEIETFTKKVERLTITLDEAMQIEGIDSVASAFRLNYLAGGSYGDIELKDITFLDQDGNEKSFDDLGLVDEAYAEGQANLDANIGKYRVKLTSSNSSVVGFVYGEGDVRNIAYLYDDVDKIETFAEEDEKSSSTIKLVLEKIVDLDSSRDGERGAWREVNDADLSLTARVWELEDIESYTVSVSKAIYVPEVADLATYIAGTEDNEDWAEEVKVEGVLKNGQKVFIPGDRGIYTISSNEDEATFIWKGEKKTMLYLNDFVFKNDDDTDTIPVTVVIRADGQNVVEVVETTVSKEEPETASLDLDVAESGTGFDVDGDTIEVTEEALYGLDGDEINYEALVSSIEGRLKAIIAEAVDAKDQYGREFKNDLADAATFYTLVPNNFDHDDRDELNKVRTGDAFDVTVIANDSGHTTTVKVKVVTAID